MLKNQKFIFYPDSVHFQGDAEQLALEFNLVFRICRMTGNESL
jgi:hypothetical protein